MFLPVSVLALRWPGARTPAFHWPPHRRYFERRIMIITTYITCEIPRTDRERGLNANSEVKKVVLVLVVVLRPRESGGLSSQN